MPAGAGEERPVDMAGIEAGYAEFLPDGRLIEGLR